MGAIIDKKDREWEGQHKFKSLPDSNGQFTHVLTLDKDENLIKTEVDEFAGGGVTQTMLNNAVSSVVGEAEESVNTLKKLHDVVVQNKNEILGGVSDSYDNLNKIVEWVDSNFSSVYTNITNSINSVKGGADTSIDTLQKLFLWTQANHATFANLNAAIDNIKGGASSTYDTLEKLYTVVVNSQSRENAATIAERDAMDIPLGAVVFVEDDGNGKWATYISNTAGVGATYTKISDEDAFNTVMTSEQIASSYESIADVERFTTSIKTYIDSLPGILNGKVDNVAGSTLMLLTDKAKLDGIQAGANNYTHPTSHAASMITETSSRIWFTPTEKSQLATLVAGGGGSGGSAVPVYSNVISSALRVGDNLYNVIDLYTGENVTFKKVLINMDGVAISDADVDNTVFFKRGSEYFQRVSPDGYVHTDWFGFLKDGTTDESSKLRTILRKYPRVKIDNGTIWVKPTDGGSGGTGSNLYTRSNQVIEWAENALIRALPSTIDQYQILSTYQSNNVLLLNPRIQGDRLNNTITNGEWGHLIEVYRSNDVRIIGGELWDAWGDGINIQGDTTGNEVIFMDQGAGPDLITYSDTRGTGLFIHGVNIHDCRRQGITVTEGRAITIVNNHIHHIGGTDPSAAIDIEPNSGDAPFNWAGHIIIANNQFHDCLHGVIVNGKNVNIAHNQFFNLWGFGVWVSTSAEYGSEIRVESNEFNNVGQGWDTGGGVIKYREAITFLGTTTVAKSNAIISKNIIKKCYNGLVMGGTWKEAAITGNHFIDCANMGVEISPSASGGNGVLSGNIFKNITTDAIFLRVPYWNIKDNVIDGARVGIQVQTCEQSVVAGNRIRNTTRHGIWVTAGGHNVEVYDNRLHSCGTSSSSYYGIFIAATDDWVYNNKITKGTALGNGLRIDSIAINALLLDNKLVGYTTSPVPYVNNGTGTILRELPTA